jgi:hypothetical protein
MRRWNWLIYIIIFFSSCRHFDGVVGRSGESYTHRYNYPSSRIAPYNDTSLVTPENPEKVKLCIRNPGREVFPVNREQKQ